MWRGEVEGEVEGFNLLNEEEKVLGKGGSVARVVVSPWVRHRELVGGGV